MIDGNLTVGETSEGTLNITAGGVVSNTDGRIGHESDSIGTVTVSGEGSGWNNSSSLNVGYSGEGTLNISDGGVVSNTSGTIGDNSDSVGIVTVTGEGSEWNNSGDLTVGRYGGSGTLNISDGGVVSNADGRIGNSSNSVGTVTVTGEVSH